MSGLILRHQKGEKHREVVGDRGGGGSCRTISRRAYMNVDVVKNGEVQSRFVGYVGGGAGAMDDFEVSLGGEQLLDAAV